MTKTKTTGHSKQRSGVGMMARTRLPRAMGTARRATTTLSPVRAVALGLSVAFLLETASAMRQNWRFRDEDRAEFLVERFGFAPHAAMELRVSGVSFSFKDPSLKKPTYEILAGLVFVHESKLWDTMAYIENGDEDVSSQPEPTCLLQNRTEGLYVDLTNKETWVVAHTVGPEPEQNDAPVLVDAHAQPRPGFYYVFYSQCTEGLKVSFDMEAEFRNPGGNYLSAGDSLLPTVYLFFDAAFLTAAISWVRYLRSNEKHIHHIHHMMSVLVVLKTISLFAESMRYYYMKSHGDTLTSWTAVYYVFVFLKGVMLFVVILLIGTGWSLLKAHLSRRDKSIISIVLVLQVLSNTAMIVTEESSVGTRKWTNWRDVLHIMDILCCFAILFPIVWSIRSLRQSAFTDGKSQINLQKLVQFRSFYVSVVTYIYVTRIALFLLAASLPYNATWLSVVVAEGAALTFFVFTGYRFRPVDQNPYLEVSTKIDSLDEFGIDDDDLEIQSPIQRKDHLRFSVRPPSPRKSQRVDL